MRRYFFLFFIWLSLLCFAQAQPAHLFQSEKIIYSFRGTEASVVGLIDSTSSEIVIPQTIERNGHFYNVTSVGNNAFVRCNNLKRIELPETINNIGSSAFAFCKNLSEISMPSAIDTICTDAFYQCNCLPIVDNIRYAGCFLVNVADCDVRELVVREGCKFVGDNAFSECHKLITVQIPNSVKVIGNFAFAGCSSLKQLSIPESVHTICFSAFAMCSGLESLRLPANAHGYPYDMLIDCYNLSELFLASRYPPFIEDNVESHNPAFDYYYRFNPQRCTLYVPRGSKKLYKDSSVWNSFKRIKILRERKDQ